MCKLKQFLLIALLFSLSCNSILAESNTQTVTPHLTVIAGPINGALLQKNGKILAVYGDPRDPAINADMVLFTHYRRDVAWAGVKLARNGAQAVVPKNEESFFSGVSQFWSEFSVKRFHDYYQQTTKILTQPIPITKTVEDGETWMWEGIPIHVLATPGYTRDAVTYILDIDEKKIAFTGDLIYGDGKILDWYSLQDAIPEAKIGGYHGYAARTAQLIDSLKKVAEQNPDLLIPARGPIIRNVQQSIARLIDRLQKAYENYLSIDALRWYFKDEHIQKKAERVLGPSTRINWMSFAETVNENLPPWIIPITNSRLILAQDGSGFLVDCGGKRIIDELIKMRIEGTLQSLDGLFITHYHDDHTDQVMPLVQEFNCPVYTIRELQDVLENPAAYRLPCLTQNPIPDLKIMEEGALFKWKEFKLTFSYHPGQTILHGALLVEKENSESIFFIGDSFTPSGIDDYCLQNRNLLHPNHGYFYCLNALRKMEPNYLLINQHVDPTFRFSRDQIDHMINVLNRRIELLRDLFPFDDPNYGLDEGWARFYPYWQTVKAGESFDLTLRIFNHSPCERTFQTALNFPEGWKEKNGEINVVIPSIHEAEAQYHNITTPKNTKPGIYVITADIQSADWDLREWTETIITIE
ncbi:MAG: MBL fold metallo-hydrolase [Candidatus Omnitrophota bacterium]|nr:MAG: MBL fold metallo-hydrolase [Candidatus Omnitrophota bacterium]